MKLKSKLIVSIILTLGLVFAGYRLIELYVAEQGELWERQQEEKMLTFVVANRTLHSNEPVLLETLSLRQLPERYAASDWITESEIDALHQQQTRVRIESGQALAWSHLQMPQAHPIKEQLAAGERAVSLQVSSDQMLNGFLQPHDRVDLVWFDQVSLPLASLSILPDVEILAIGRDTGATKELEPYNDSSSLTFRLRVDQLHKFESMRMNNFHVWLKPVKESNSIRLTDFTDIRIHRSVGSDF